MSAKNIILLILLALSSKAIFGQCVIYGKVTDATTGEAIIGANLYLKGTYDGTSTDLEGRFSFSTSRKDSAYLAASYLGYHRQEEGIWLTKDSLYLEFLLKPEASELDMVVITAGAFEASDEKKSVILRPLDIVTTAGATADIAGALNTLPGTQTVGEEGRLFVRGGDAYETRTFIDGMLVQRPFTSSVPDVPARGRFSPFLFKGTTFSTGGYSAEFGRALSSALLLETQGLADETLTSVSLMSIGGGLSHTQRWEESSLSLSADYTNLGPYTGLVPQNIEWEKPVSAGGGQAVYRKQFGDDAMLKAQGSVQLSSLSMLYPDPEQVENQVSLSLGNDNYYANATYSDLINEKWSLDAGLAYGYDQEHITQDFDLNRNSSMLQSRVKATHYPNDKLMIKTGIEWTQERFDEQFTDADGRAFNTLLESDYWAAFAEGEAYLSNNLALRLGFRGEHFGLLDQWAAAPRLSIAYKTGASSQVSLAFGQFYQQPENEWLRYNIPEQLERSSHYILNYQYSKDKRIFRAEAYYKKYDQLLRFDTGQPWIQDNQGEGFARGLDLFYRDRQLIDNGDFWLSYSFLDTEREYRGYPEAATPGFASKHNFSAVYKHWINALSTSIGLTYAYASPRPYNNPNTSDFNAERTAAYQNLSFNASYLTNLFGHFTIVYFSVTNVPGFEQSFGYRYSEQPNANGQYSSLEIEPPAKRFLFLGCFISIGQKFDNQ